MSRIIDPLVIERAKSWLGSSFDYETRRQVQSLLDNDPQEIVESFYKDLEFGTGGLRGIMGVGTNRMNKYTVGMATQGLAEYVKQAFPGEELRAAVAYDSRNNSPYFARITAEVLSANGFTVFLFNRPSPTPLLSFAIRELNCNTGIVITASHNPKEYNGYKVYWNDGGQLVFPHDENVIAEVQKVGTVENVKFAGNESLIKIIGREFDDIYVNRITSLSLSREIIQRFNNLSIVYTPLHGSGVELVPKSLKAFGFTNIYSLESQCVVDGDFPTVHSPNPEEPEAMKLALELGIKVNADLILATDPDADRVGVAVRDRTGNFVLLNGNQTASVMIYYLLEKWKEKGWITGNEFIAKTIVTSELLRMLANDYRVECIDVLTGFKYIAEIIRQQEGLKRFIGGGEESYGYLVGDFVRDKDAVISCCIIAETTAWAKSQEKSFYDVLIDLYCRFGFYKERLISITRKGKSGSEEISAMMRRYRTMPPKILGGVKVTIIRDYNNATQIALDTGTTSPVESPRSDVLQFFLEDGSKITVRPSGTEPKIKFYFGIRGTLASDKDFDKVNAELDLRIEQIVSDMEI